MLGSAGCGDTDPVLGPAAPEDQNAEIRELTARVNQHRLLVGCESLVWHVDAAAVAQRHSEDMVARRFLAHTNPDGHSPADRLRNAGIGFGAWGENLAAGIPNARTVLQKWLGSPGHRRNVERCRYTHHGIGLHQQHWTHLFLTPR